MASLLFTTEPRAQRVEKLCKTRHTGRVFGGHGSFKASASSSAIHMSPQDPTAQPLPSLRTIALSCRSASVLGAYTKLIADPLHAATRTIKASEMATASYFGQHGSFSKRRKPSCVHLSCQQCADSCIISAGPWPSLVSCTGRWKPSFCPPCSGPPTVDCLGRP